MAESCQYYSGIPCIAFLTEKLIRYMLNSHGTQFGNFLIDQTNPLIQEEFSDQIHVCNEI